MPAVLVPFFVALGAGAAAAAVYAAVTELVILTLVSRLIAPGLHNGQGTTLSAAQSEEYSGTVQPRRIVYGTNLISGMNAIPPWCHGPSNEYLDQLLVVAGHPVSHIGDVYLNQEKVLSSAIAAISGTTGDGLIGTGGYANKIWVRRYDGTQSTVDFILHAAWPTYWTTAHVGQGCAYVAVQYLYDAAVYANGKPDIRVLVDGKKCYDPRLDTTPGAHPTNPTYFAFTTNPALCIVDYLLDTALGLGEDPTRIDWVAATAAANTCDESVAIPGSTTQKRYTCSVVLDATEEYETNLQTLAGSMQGAVLYSSGKWVLLPGKYLTPSFSITDGDIAGQFDFRTAIPYKDRYNAIRGQFYDPTVYYQPAEYSPARVFSDEADDGETVWRELQQATCTNTYEAQRNAMILQRMSRRRRSWTIAVHYGLYGVRPGDFGTLTIAELGLSAQTVKCTGWKLDGKSMGIQMGLTEVLSTDWDDPSTVTYAAPGTILSPAPPGFVPAPVGNLSASGASGGTTLKWTLPAIWHSNLVVEVYESATNVQGAAVLVWQGVNTQVYLPQVDTSTHYYWTRVLNMGGGERSTWNPVGVNAGLAAAATSVSAGPPGKDGQGGLAANLTLSSVIYNADSTGHISTYPPVNGQFRVFLGTVEVTAQCVFTLAPGGDPDGILYSLSPSGAYSITGGMADDVDFTTLTIRALYVPT